MIDPFLTAWGEALDLGMSNIVHDNQGKRNVQLYSPALKPFVLVSPKSFVILFNHMIKALNELVRVVWNVCFGSPPEVALELPLVGQGSYAYSDLSRGNSELYASLLDYFRSPLLEAYPVVESFKAELKHHAHYLPGKGHSIFHGTTQAVAGNGYQALVLANRPLSEVLLKHVLRRLGDAVVLEVLLNAEMTDDGQIKTVDPNGEMRQGLMKFTADLKAQIEQIRRVSELDWEDGRSTEPGNSKRKRALEDPEPGST